MNEKSEIKVTDYASREELESFCEDISPAEFIITGTIGELRAFGLSDRTSVWGIRCVATNAPPDTPKQETPDRGKIHPFGKTNNLKQPPQK